MSQTKQRWKEWYQENKERYKKYQIEYNAKPEVKERRRIKAHLEWEESKRKRLENTFG